MATDPKELEKQLNVLNDELNQINDQISDIGQNLTNSVRNQLVASVDSTRRLSQNLSTSKDLSKDIKDIQRELNKALLKNDQLSISRNIAEKKLNKAIQDGNTSLEKRYRKEFQSLSTQLKLVQSTEDQTRKLLQIAESERRSTEEKKKQNSLTGVLGKKYNDIFKSFEKGAILSFIFKSLIDSAFRFSRISTEVGKNLGYSADQADRVTENFVQIAQSSSNSNVTLQNLGEAANELAASTGLVAEYTADTLETQIMLTKQFGLTGDEAGKIYEFSVLAGKAASTINREMVGAFVATRNNLRAGIPFKAAIAEASKVSGQLAANLQNNPSQIVKAVVQAKALGTSLEQVARQGESLLNFESSIEGQLKAELLTGKQLNLERARAAALAGDQIALAEELNKNVGSLEEFQRMNVLQQKALAEAVGLTSDQLADQLRKQKLAVESGKSLAQITEEEALQAQQRQNAQDKFNNAVTKLQDLVGNLVAGPFGQLLDIVSDIAGVIFKILGPIVDIAGKILGPILKGISGVVGALGLSTADDMTGYGARTLITPQGAVALNNNDTVIAGTNLFKGDDVMSYPKGALSIGSDNSEMVSILKEVKSAIVAGNNKTFGVNLDGRSVGTGVVRASYKSA